MGKLETLCLQEEKGSLPPHPCVMFSLSATLVCAQGAYGNAGVKAAGAGSQAPGGQEQLLLHSVASLVGGTVIPGTGNTFDVSTKTQRIFLKAIDVDEVGPKVGPT